MNREAYSSISNTLLRVAPDLFQKKRLFFVGSASSAIYLALKSKKFSGNKILIPSNICYSVPLSIIYSDNIPIFYDVHSLTGLPSIQSINNAVHCDDEIQAVIYPHMFGNVDSRFVALFKKLKKQDLCVIEDCASALGSRCKDRFVGSYGDFSVYSFSANKHIDMRYGGILTCDADIDIKALLGTINQSRENFIYKTSLFNKIYKALLYSKDYFLLLGNLEGFVPFMKDAFIYNFEPSEGYKSILVDKINQVEPDTFERIHMVEYIDKHINFGTNLLRRYNFSAGASPWRYNLLCDTEQTKEELLCKLVNSGLKVSKWYPPIDQMFGFEAKVNARVFYSSIINFDFRSSTTADTKKFIQVVNEHVMIKL